MCKSASALPLVSLAITGLNSLNNWGESYGSLNRVIGAPKGKYIDFTKAIELNPKFADAYYNRGFAMSKLNNKNAACQDFSKARELGLQGNYDLINQYCN